MRRQLDPSSDSFVQRHLSQLKILARLVEHELGAAKSQDVTMDRELVESLLDTIEIFVDDLDVRGRREKDGVKSVASEKPQTVTRLN